MNVLLLNHFFHPDLSATAQIATDPRRRLGASPDREPPHQPALPREFERQTGVGLVLNTSFNEHEPIVASPADAIACYLKTRMDVLALGNWVLARRRASQTGTLR